MTYFLALNVLYNVVETLYTAYYAIGLFIYVFTLVSYIPFLMSFMRMLKRDNETRRLIFYRSSRRLWLVMAGIDLWILSNVIPDVVEMCDMTRYLPNSAKIA